MLGVEGWGVEEVSAPDSYWEETREAAQHPGCRTALRQHGTRWL